MKKRIIVLSILLIIGISVYDFFDVKLDELSKGEFLSEQPSPDNKYNAKAYLIDDGGATVRAAIRVEIDYGSESKTIYWNYDESTANLKWLDNKTIKINDHTLNIFHDTYHWKKDPEWDKNRGNY